MLKYRKGVITMKKVLIIGGTYFAGRVFAMIASKDPETHLTFINRGRFSMNHLPNVTEYKCDRRDAEGLAAIPYGEYDAVVDFCAYEEKDARTLLTNLNGKFGQYILISTADVYDRNIRTPKDESTPLQTEKSFCAASDYMWNKMLLEGDATAVCKELNIPITIFRPAFIYGPYNYAPRESFYVQLICQEQSIPQPSDSDSKFNFVYVKDVANAIVAAIGNEKAYGEAFNLAGPEEITYNSFMYNLAIASDVIFETYEVTVQEVIQNNIPLPFPLTADENELFIGTKAQDVLGIEYTPFKEGIARAYDAFKGVYSR